MNRNLVMLSESQSVRRYCYPLVGLYRLKEPGIRWFVMTPVLINILVFAGFGWWAFHEFNGWVSHLMASLPDWLGFLAWLLWPLFTVMMILVSAFSFTLVANIIASPFNAFLAEYVQKPYGFEAKSDWKAMLAMVPASIQREVKKICFYLPRVILLLVISLIPVVNIFSPILWFLFSAWMMAIQYADYPADNRGVTFQKMVSVLKKNRLKSLFFGMGVLVMSMIPLLNFFVMPSAVIGAACFWEENANESGS